MYILCICEDYIRTYVFEHTYIYFVKQFVYNIYLYSHKLLEPLGGLLHLLHRYGFWRAEIYFLCVWNLLRKWFRDMSCKWNRNAVCTSRCVWHRRGRYLHLLISLFGGWNQVKGDDLRVWNCMVPAVEFGEVASVKLAWDPRPSVWCWCCNYLIKLTHIN